MARNRQIEAILEAWWEWDHCSPAKKAQCKQKCFELAEASIGKRPLTPLQLLEYLRDRYSEFKASRRKAEKLRIAQSVLRK